MKFLDSFDVKALLTWKTFQKHGTVSELAPIFANLRKLLVVLYSSFVASIFVGNASSIVLKNSTREYKL